MRALRARAGGDVTVEEIARDHGLDEQAIELCKAAALERFEAED